MSSSRSITRRQVAIIGAVNEQSRFELQRRVRLLELLTYARGPSAKAGQTINIVHSTAPSLCRAGSDDEIAAFSSYKLSDTMVGDPKANPYVEAGDIVTLPEADQIYVVGNVYTPVTIPLKEPLTLSRAIAMAGGAKTGYEERQDKDSSSGTWQFGEDGNNRRPKCDREETGGRPGVTP